MNFKFLLLLIMPILLLQLASAARYIDYEFKQGIISESGQLTPTNTPLTNVGALGYVCLNASCSAVGEQIFNLNSGSNDNIQLTYPTDLKSQYGYAVYFYKPDYIAWEQNPSWWGTNPADPQGPYTKYLSRKQNCHAPIESFSIINEAQPNIPLYITAQAVLDAEAYSALFHAGPLEYVPQELTQYYQVQTEVQLLIYDEQDNLVHFDEQEVFIDFSGSADVEFEWTPTLAGKYKAVMITNIIDNKCSSSEEETISKQFSVLAENPRNKCYTIINDLETSNQFPSINEPLTIQYAKISNYVDNNYILTALPTSVTYELREGKDNANGNLIYSEQYNLPANPDTLNPQNINFEWNMPSQQGWYTIYITGQCNAPICNSVENIQDNISESIYLGVNSNHVPLITTTPITQALKNVEYRYNVDATDLDNDNLVYSLTQAPEGMEINQNTGLITWMPDKLGNFQVTVKVDDNKDGFDIQNFSINVDSLFHKKHLFVVSSVNLPCETYYASDNINGFILLRNLGHLEEKKISVKVSVPELGIEDYTSQITLGTYDSKWIPFEITLPDDIQEGEYLIKVEVKNSKMTATKFTTFSVKDKYIFQ